jgi:hypothetical protein
MNCPTNNQFLCTVTKLYGQIVRKLHDIVLFLFKTQRFGDWILSPSSGKS